MMVVTGNVKPAGKPVVSMTLVAVLISISANVHAYQRNLAPNPYYLDGIKCSREDVRDQGEMLTGFAVGFTLPFFTYLTTEASYKNIHRSNKCGAVGGILGLSFWLWGGNKLIKNKKITIPEHHLTHMENKYKDDFKKGYHEGVYKFRKTQYKKGVALGLGTVIMIPLMFIAYAVSQVN